MVVVQVWYCRCIDARLLSLLGCVVLCSVLWSRDMFRWTYYGSLLHQDKEGKKVHDENEYMGRLLTERAYEVGRYGWNYKGIR